MKVTLAVIKGPEQGRVFDFDSPDTFMVGRAKDCHFRLSSDDPYVSRRHFILEICPPRCVLKDLNSTNRAKVNGVAVSEQEMNHGDVIEVGYTLIQVSIHQAIKYNKCARCGQSKPSLAAGDEPDLCEECLELLHRSKSVSHPPRKSLTIRCGKCGCDLTDGPNSDGRAEDLLGEVEYRCQGCVHLKAQGSQKIKDYYVLGTLGKGGFGRVDLVYDKNTCRLLALKKMLNLSNEIMVKRFEREVRFTQELVHENLIRYVDSGVDGKEPYLVMQYVRDGSLDSMMLSRGRPLDPEDAVNYIAGTLSGLEVMHDNKIVHRDIKPQNILIKKTDSGEKIPKITDYGLAKKYNEAGGMLLTQRGDRMGTILYMPPEQIKETRNVREPGDLYSMGVTLYYLLTGQFPYNFPTNLEIQRIKEQMKRVVTVGEILNMLVQEKKLSPMAIILSNNPIPIRERTPGIPEALARVVDRSIKKDIDQRYQTAKDFRNDLLAAL